MTRPHRATEWLGRLGVPSLRVERPFEGIPFLGFSLRSLGLSLPSFPSFPLFGSGIAALPACATEVRRPVFSGLRPLVSAGRARRCFSRNSALWYWPGSAKSGSAKSQLTCPSISEAAESIMFGPPNTFDGAAADGGAALSKWGVICIGPHQTELLLVLSASRSAAVLSFPPGVAAAAPLTGFHPALAPGPGRWWIILSAGCGYLDGGGSVRRVGRCDGQ